MAKQFYLSESDQALLREWISVARHSPRNVHNRHGKCVADDEEMMAPEVYVARTPEDGIPALDENNVIGTGSGTGSDVELIAFDDDEPGYASCNVYRVDLVQHTGTGNPTPTLVSIDELTRRVYNLSTTEIAGNKLILIIRDKWDSWFAVSEGSSAECTPGEIVRCHERVVDVRCETGVLEVDKVFDYLDACGRVVRTTDEPCWDGTDCCDFTCEGEDVVLTLTGTVSNNAGSFADLPTTINYTCDNTSATRHGWITTDVEDESPLSFISCTADGRPRLTTGEGFLEAEMASGCDPYSATWYYDDGDGNTFVLVVTS